MTAQERVENMGTQKLLPLLFSMAVPAILANLVNALYNVGDRLFVGRLVGSDALGAVGLTFPLSFPSRWDSAKPKKQMKSSQAFMWSPSRWRC